MIPAAKAALPLSPPLILASGSPRRARLFTMLGLAFEIDPAGIDERYFPDEAPHAHAERLAREKALHVSARRGNAIVVGSDTVVVVDGAVLGKPRDADEAVAMLLQLQGREHTVATGIAVAENGQVRSAVEQVRVFFRGFDARIARAYVETGEPMDKAGAYGIQGYGAALVERIEGDFYAVMGLPVARLLALLEAAGWRYDFRGLGR
ncbi:MAG: Maf family protein [Gemmatimonadetes bacterium]|nr:Maf family protein [Gemmatimonadota bacterium]